MNRLALLFLLSILVISSSATAQTGWVRMPDGPWIHGSRVYFVSEDTGFVEDVKYGLTLYFTYDGGKSWSVDPSLEGREGLCIRQSSTEIKRNNIAGRSFTSERLVFTGSEYIRTCSQGEAMTATTWTFDLRSQKWSASRFSGGRTDTLGNVGNVLFASSLKYILPQGERGDPFVLRSIDHGYNWEQLTVARKPENSRLGARFANRDTGVVWADFFVNGQGLGFDFHWTSDGGKSWRIQSHPPESGVFYREGPYYGNNDLWYQDSGTGLMSSRDLGLTWEEATIQPIILPQKPDDSYYSQFAGYNITNLDSTYSLIAWREDSGGMWNEMQAVVGYLNEISAPNERIAYAVGPNGLLYKTTDGGGRFASVASIEDKSTKLKAWSSGNGIIVENAGGEIRVLDLLGRVVRTSRGEKLDGFVPGVYFVVSGDESVRVLVSPM